MRTTLLPFIYLWSLSTGVGGGQTSGSLVGSSSFERRGPPKWTVSFLKLARVWFISLTWSYSLTIDWRTFKWGQKIRNVYGFKNITKINFQTESGSILQIHSLPLLFSHMKRKNLHHKWNSVNRDKTDNITFQVVVVVVVVLQAIFFNKETLAILFIASYMYVLHLMKFQMS